MILSSSILTKLTTMGIEEAMIEHSHLIPPQCPVCSGALYVERVRCATCGSAVEGRFTLDWPARLTREQLNFVRVFVTCGGKIKDVEQALGVSYPTVVSRLDEIMAAIGVIDGDGRAPKQSRSRRDVLERLSNGEIDAQEAERLLKKEKERP
ncbi:MAG: DUF2089 domain-containing protein [Myxococcaceae bacterium]|nr:DUF2089 domain-containing protein [Myxococcaceae bacterium]